jgi:hypothetical protein
LQTKAGEKKLYCHHQARSHKVSDDQKKEHLEKLPDDVTLLRMPSNANIQLLPIEST